MHVACKERLQQSILGYMQRPDTLAFPPPLQNISVGSRGYARYFIPVVGTTIGQRETRITILKANGNAKLERIR